jgi:hypothetical protein
VEPSDGAVSSEHMGRGVPDVGGEVSLLLEARGECSEVVGEEVIAVV